MKTKHTEGEWEIKTLEMSEFKYGVYCKGHGFICFLPDVSYWAGQDERFRKDTEEAIANGNLLESAPNLLEACKKALDTFKQLADSGNYPHPLLASHGGEGFEFLVHAIKEATGETI